MTPQAQHNANQQPKAPQTPEAPQHIIPSAPPREAGLTIATGFQGTGKSYQTLHTIVRYLRNHPHRKVLIYDINGEFDYETCMKHGVNINIPKLGTTLNDIQRFTAHQTERIRRIVPIDPKTGRRMDISQLRDLLVMVLENFTKGLLLIEDMNRYLRQIKDLEKVVGVLIALRHQNLDAIIHLQSLGKIDPTLFQNTKYIRMHWQSDDIDSYEGRIPNYKLFKVAQVLVKMMYEERRNKNFFCWVYPQQNKIEGAFSKADFKVAYYRYLKIEKREIANECSIMNLDYKNIDQRLKAVDQLYRKVEYMYGNPV